MTGHVLVGWTVSDLLEVRLQLRAGDDRGFGTCLSIHPCCRNRYLSIPGEHGRQSAGGLLSACRPPKPASVGPEPSRRVGQERRRGLNPSRGSSPPLLGLLRSCVPGCFYAAPG